jgi:2-keto-4-pentenoate hydratase/2-oxohepta-3-ene-1,7-dioic acid hydratase in catechol pathway
MRTIYAVDDVMLLSPIPRPPGIACFANRPAHIQDSREKGFTMPNFPPLDGELRAYHKGNPDSVVGTGAPLLLPSYADEYDVGCEFAAIIGGTNKDIDKDEALRAIVGYCVYNDVSFRKMQNREMPLGLGRTKGRDADNSNVLGPWMTAPDEIGDVHDLTMSFHVNGVQQSTYSTSKMAWDHADLLSYLSRVQTLRPGHVLTSGCYPGGSALDLGIKVSPGDRVEMRIEQLGSITNVLS